MSLTRERKCFWCGKKLAAISHAEVQIQPGQVVQVHKVCEANTRALYKPITAQPAIKEPR